MFLNPDRGIVEIQMTVAPRFSLSKINMVDLSQLQQTQEYAVGYKYFIQKHAQNLGSKAQV